MLKIIELALLFILRIADEWKEEAYLRYFIDPAHLYLKWMLCAKSTNWPHKSHTFQEDAEYWRKLYFRRIGKNPDQIPPYNPDEIYGNR